MAILDCNSHLLFSDLDNGPVTPEKQEFVRRLEEVCRLLKYPERGRQTMLAQRYKLKQPSVRKWFVGEAMPSYEIAVDLCKRALVHYEWLMTGRGDKFYGAEQFQDVPLMREVREVFLAIDPEERPQALRTLHSFVEPPPEEKKNNTNEGNG